MDALVDERAFVLVRRTKISINVIQEEALRIKVLFMTEISDCRDQGKCFRGARSPTQPHFDSDLSHVGPWEGGSVPFTLHCGPGGSTRARGGLCPCQPLISYRNLPSALSTDWGSSPTPGRQARPGAVDRTPASRRFPILRSPQWRNPAAGEPSSRECTQPHTLRADSHTSLLTGSHSTHSVCRTNQPSGLQTSPGHVGESHSFQLAWQRLPNCSPPIFKKLIYLGLAMLGLCCLLCGHCSRCRVRASPCGGPSCCCSRAPSSGSTDAVRWPSCSTAGGNLPDRASNPCLLHWRVDSCPLSCQGSSSLQLHLPPLF